MCHSTKVCKLLRFDQMSMSHQIFRRQLKESATLPSCLMTVRKQVSAVSSESTQFWSGLLVLITADSCSWRSEGPAGIKNTATGFSLMDDQPGAGDLNCPHIMRLRD